MSTRIFKNSKSHFAVYKDVHLRIFVIIIIIVMPYNNNYDIDIFLLIKFSYILTLTRKCGGEKRKSRNCQEKMKKSGIREIERKI